MHSVHPVRIALRRVARAASVLVCEARALVLQRQPSHLPMWQLHSGSKDWLRRISSTNGYWGCDEYDVNDCFLNTPPRHEVLGCSRFWIDATAAHSRRQPCFALSKDGKKGDHRGRPCSVHYWEITCEQLMLAFEWELEHNNTFQVQSGDGVVVLQQRKGLPIGGHLSAAFVELFALRHECVRLWPPVLMHCPTTRYHDNFFVVLLNEPVQAQRQATAAALSMPVAFERGGRIVRCLELRISWLNAEKVQAVLAYRTDADRQGESHDVRTWPEWHDPRTWLVLHGLGSASWLNHEACDVLARERWGTSGLTPTSATVLACSQLPNKGLAAPFCIAAVTPGRALCCLAARFT